MAARASSCPNSCAEKCTTLGLASPTKVAREVRTEVEQSLPENSLPLGILSSVSEGHTISGIFHGKGDFFQIQNTILGDSFQCDPSLNFQQASDLIQGQSRQVKTVLER